MKSWMLLLLCLTGFCTARAQLYSALDKHAKSIPVEGQSDLPKLVQQLIAPAHSDLEKARVLFVWTATNIQYNDSQVKLYQFGSAVESIDTLAVATQILRRKQGVCTEYSLLLYQLLRTAGLDARIVTGYAKGVVNQAGTPVKSINHQWNEVYLDGRWQPLDATWASTNKGTRPLNLYYFLTPPAQFMANHFSINAGDQLVKNRLTKAEFDSLPRVYDHYFTLGFGPDFPRRGLYQINRILSVSVDNSADMEFVVLAHRYGQPKHERTVYYKANRLKKGYELFMQIFRRGVYSVHVLARPKGDLSDYGLILTFTVISSS